jgi:hypothetical protein
MYELRYIVRPSWDGPEKVLQYRTQIEVSDYSAVNPRTSDYIRKLEWTEWRDVPVVDETK